MRVLTLIAAAACTMSAAAWADENRTENRDAQVLCKRQQDSDTGSHLNRGRRVCRTRGEWRELDQLTEREIRQLRDRERNSVNQGMGARQE